MSLPNNTYSTDRAAQMQVVFSAQFSSTLTGADWWTGSTATNIVIECTVSNTSGTLARTYIDFKNPSAVVVFAYAGGGSALTMAMTVSSYAVGGLGSVTCSNPTIAVFLMP